VRELKRVLIANRGEIAVRIVRAARDEGLTSIAVHGPADRDARHVRLADEAVSLGEGTPAETYLSIPAVLEAAAVSGADSVHPGYGFLSENADFAQAVLDAGLTWIGPPPSAIHELGDKVRAREIARRVGAPLVPGTSSAVRDAEEVMAFAEEHGLPVAIKAAFGGGGRGLKVARAREEIPHLFESAVREAVAAFGRGDCFVERYLDRPRHVEAQVLADRHGRVVVVGTRDCSLQRRHQKLVEEAPAPFLSPEQVARIRESARAICREAGYVGAGTVEYLVGRDGTVSFLEVNTRLQVEHPVTEETTGIDLVRQMFRIAAGDHLELPDDPPARGHAIEFRINAEDPARGFVPTPGTITALTVPEGPGVRFDSGVDAGDPVDGSFDSLIAKLIVSGADRQQALERSRRALAELEIGGLTTVVPFHRAVVGEPAFTATTGEDFAVHTGWIETEFAPPGEPPEAVPLEPDVVRVVIGGRQLAVRLPGLASHPEADAIRAEARSATTEAAAHGAVTAPMQGTVVKVAVEEGQEVDAGDLIAVVEAMKMENPVRAPRAGTVTGLRVAVGDTTRQDAVLCELT
jgi:acetyl-CoA/propionyl-CoA carboxylase biotin carboxyl carrier protein